MLVLKPCTRSLALSQKARIDALAFRRIKPRSTPGSSEAYIVGRCPGDLPVVDFRVGEIRLAAFKELSFYRLLRYTTSRSPDLVGHLVHFIPAFGHDRDSEANTTLAGLLPRTTVSR